VRPRGRTLPALVVSPATDHGRVHSGALAGSSRRPTMVPPTRSRGVRRSRLLRGCSSAGRAAALQAVGRGFESLHLHWETHATDTKGPRHRRLAPAHPTQHMGAAPSGSRALVVTFGLSDAVAPDCLAVAGRAPLHAAPGMMDAAQWRPAITTFFRLIAVPGAEFLPPGDRGVDLSVDDDGVSQAADPLCHLSTTLRTNGHDPPLFSCGDDHLRPV
jgi:hypothetical protein